MAQTFHDFEILAVDDSSTDDTRALLEQWTAREGRLRILAGNGTGLVAALSSAAEASRAPLLGRMDADDSAHPEHFARQIKMLAADPGLAACGTHVRYFPRAGLTDGALNYEAWLNSLVAPRDLKRDIFVECPIAHPTLVIRRAVFEAVGGYQERGWPEDYDLLLRLNQRGERMCNVAAILLDWREGPDRRSRTDPRYSEDAFRRCKAFYLGGCLRSQPRRVLIWGAGRSAKHSGGPWLVRAWKSRLSSMSIPAKSETA